MKRLFISLGVVCLTLQAIDVYAPVDASAVPTSYRLSLNAENSVVGAIRSTKWQNGNAPQDPGAECSFWSKAEKGGATGEVDCDEEATVTLSGGGSSSILNHVQAYQTFSDSGDIQAKGQIPAEYVGNDELFTAGGYGIFEGGDPTNWGVSVWCPIAESARCSSGTISSLVSEIGAAGPCYGKDVAVYYDVSATDLVCLESSDGENYTQVGATIDHTLDCESNNCLVGPWMYGRSDITTTGVFTEIDIGTEIDVVPADPDPDPDPPAPGANIIWGGGRYDNGNLSGWHRPGDPNLVTLPLIPAYGRCINYGGVATQWTGNGELCEIVRSTASGIYNQGPVREGLYAMKLTIKSTANDSEPADCDSGNTVCSRRRSELTAQHMLVPDYNALQYLGRYAMSASFYVQSGWSSVGSSWGINVVNIKPRSEASTTGSSGIYSYSISNDAWVIHHRTDDAPHPPPNYDWWQQMTYAGANHHEFGGQCYPRSNNWADGVADFPNVTASCNALNDVPKNVWIDWVTFFTLDGRGESGNGRIQACKRVGSGPWVKVLDIQPDDTMNRGGHQFERGIGYRDETNGYGMKAGMYGDLEQFQGIGANRVMYHDNIQIGNANATCSDMTPDGSSCPCTY